MADEKSAAQKIAGKTGNFYEKHKTSIWIGAAVLGIFVIWLVMRGGSSASDTGSDANAANVSPDSSNLGPSLGGGSFGEGGFNGAPGPAGPAGPAGPKGSTGAKGSPGKPPSLWQIAKEALEGQGIRNPSNSQIWHERRTLFGIGKKKVARRPGPVKPPKVTPAHQLAATAQYTHVNAGQTSATVAAKNGMTTSSLHALNPGLGSTGALVGQRVRIK